MIKISDKGDSFPRTYIDKVYQYSYTTQNHDIQSERAFILSGMGFGLPLARVYSRYFGGDLHILPFQGLGTDVIVYLNKLCDNTKERLK